MQTNLLQRSEAWTLTSSTWTMFAFRTFTICLGYTSGQIASSALTLCTTTLRVPRIFLLFTFKTMDGKAHPLSLRLGRRGVTPTSKTYRKSKKGRLRHKAVVPFKSWSLHITPDRPTDMNGRWLRIRRVRSTQ